MALSIGPTDLLQRLQMPSGRLNSILFPEVVWFVDDACFEDDIEADKRSKSSELSIGTELGMKDEVDGFVLASSLVLVVLALL